VSPYHSSRSKLYAAGVFTLALLVLVITCPLKRMVQQNLTASASTQKFNRPVVHQSVAVDYSDTVSCCALKKKEHVIQASVVNPGVPSPARLVPYLTVVQGFGIHYFLSRDDHESPAFSLTVSLSLPLFLQHLRLRV
ncbi:MAG TPA: hypothetical protein VGE66_13970, partial [Chitinophagaceae bacterium]